MKLRQSDFIGALLILIISSLAISGLAYLNVPNLVITASPSGVTDIEAEISPMGVIQIYTVTADFIVTLQLINLSYSLLLYTHLGHPVAMSIPLDITYSTEHEFYFTNSGNYIGLYLTDSQKLTTQLTFDIFIFPLPSEAEIQESSSMVSLTPLHLVLSFPDRIEPEKAYPTLVEDRISSTLKIVFLGYYFDSTPISQKIYAFWGYLISLANFPKISPPSFFQSPIFREFARGSIFRVQSALTTNDSVVIVITLFDGYYRRHLYVDAGSVSNTSDGDTLMTLRQPCVCASTISSTQRIYYANFQTINVTLYVDEKNGFWSSPSSNITRWIWSATRSGVILSPQVSDFSSNTTSSMDQIPPNDRLSVPDYLYSIPTQSNIYIYPFSIEGINRYEDFTLLEMQSGGRVTVLFGVYSTSASGDATPILLVITPPGLNYQELSIDQLRPTVSLVLVPSLIYLLVQKLRQQRINHQDLYPHRNQHDRR